MSSVSDITSIVDWRIKRLMLAHMTALRIEEVLQVPSFFKKRCFLYMYGERPDPQQILTLKIIPDDTNLLKSLWVLLNHPIGSSFGQRLIRLFRSHGIKRSEVRPGDFLYMQDENVAHEFTASGFKPKENWSGLDFSGKLNMKDNAGPSTINNMTSIFS